MQLPAVKVTEAGRVVPFTSRNGDDGQEDGISEKKSEDQIVKSRQRLERRPVPIALTCVKHKNHLLSDPSAEEESTLQTSLTVIMDSSDRLVSFYKPGGAVTATSATVKVSLVKLTFMLVACWFQDCLRMSEAPPMCNHVTLSCKFMMHVVFFYAYNWVPYVCLRLG